METQALAKQLQKLPDLHQVEESPIDLSSDYWTPETDGEFKVGIITSIENSIYTDEKTGECLELPCMIMIEQTKEGQLKQIRNGSKRLVAAIESAESAGAIEFGQTPLKIIFLGKSKNKTNQYMSDRWSIKPLLIQS